MTRYDLSKPVKSLLEYAVLKPGATFFDYGSGQGSDVRGLQALGYEAEGWDLRRAFACRQSDEIGIRRFAADDSFLAGLGEHSRRRQSRLERR